MGANFQITSYDFVLPEAQIAQHPAVRRDESRLLSVDGQARVISHHNFSAIVDLINPEDVLIINDTKVFPARLKGKKDTGGQVELLLLQYPLLNSAPQKDCNGFRQHVSGVKGLVKSSKRPKPDGHLLFGCELEAVVEDIAADGSVRVTLMWNGDMDELLLKYGVMPLPPYIRRDGRQHAGNDVDRYQTVYARESGAIAAPTAGLHFTGDLLEAVKVKGAKVAAVTLHVGYGTFAPVRVTDIRDHKIHSEWVTISPEVSKLISDCRQNGGKVWSVGTTTTRALEFAADGNGGVNPISGPCDIYIYEGYRYKVVDTLITNFHLPKSSLLFMVCAFAGKELVLQAYQEALREGYRFYSYGDAMVLTRGLEGEG
nr:tRNA preQ1(34) S-adenosylmethionine ribosyltransferase-isomerase QueA [Desulfobulbaceae bacterium]